jgi:DNA polymerase-4
MQQYSLFENNDNERLSKLDTAIDSIRKKYGKESVLRASLITPTDTSTESN